MCWWLGGFIVDKIWYCYKMNAALSNAKHMKKKSGKSFKYRERYSITFSLVIWYSCIIRIVYFILKFQILNKRCNLAKSLRLLFIHIMNFIYNTCILFLEKVGNWTSQLKCTEIGIGTLLCLTLMAMDFWHLICVWRQ